MKLVALALSVLVGCGGSKPPPPVAPPSPPIDQQVAAPPAPPPPPADRDIDSKDIQARPAAAGPVLVKHVLIGWKDLERKDPRAETRTNAQAANLAIDVLARLKAAPETIDALVKELSEDPGSLTGDGYEVTADSPYVPAFRDFALRLNLGEAGIVKTHFGYHVMERVAPPPPDPLESADVLARTEVASDVWVKHVLIAWQGTQSTDATRTKDEADKLAKDTLAKIKKGTKIETFMKTADDPGAKDGKAYEVTPATPMVPPFKAMALRLKVKEAGLVKTVFGWHIIQRIPPDPPDRLESTKILARTEVAPKTKVKHILLGYKDAHAEDPRGTARTRAQVDKLVKATVAKLQKGEKIEPLMAELSEDPGSAATGEAYDVTPDAGLVAPFKNLSLRLKVGEVGVVKTVFGFHIIQRTE